MPLFKRIFDLNRSIHRKLCEAPIVKRSFSALVCIDARQLHHTSRRSKDFDQNENLFMMNILYNSTQHHKFQMQDNFKSDKLKLKPNFSIDEETICDINWRCKLPSEVLYAFIYISHNKNSIENLTDNKMDGLLFGVSKILNDIKDNELIEVLHAFSKWQLIDYDSHSPSYSNCRNSINRQCKSRINQWNFKTQFTVAYYFFTLRWNRVTDYLQAMLTNMSENIQEMNKNELIQFMFYGAAGKFLPKDYSNTFLFYHIQNNLYDMTADEMAIVAIGFYRSRIDPPSELIHSFYEKLIDKIQTIDDEVYSGILKMFMRSKFNHAEMSLLFEKSKYVIERLSHVTLLRLLEIGCLSNSIDSKILNFTIGKVLRDLSNIRLKDISRLLEIISVSGKLPEGQNMALEKIQSELLKSTRIPYILQRPGYFLSILRVLCEFGYYPKDLIECALHSSTLDMLQLFKIVDGNCSKLLYLQNTMEILNLYQDIDKLTDEMICVLHQILRNKIPSLRRSSNANSNKVIERCLNQYFGDEKFWFKTQVLPHYLGEDFVVCTNLCGDLVQIPPKFKSTPLWAMKYPISEGNANLIWNIIFIASDDDFCFDIEENERNMKKKLAVKLDQVSKMGYKPIMILDDENLENNIVKTLKHLKQ